MTTRHRPSGGLRCGSRVGPLARVVVSAPGSVEPRIMGMGVVPAVGKVLELARLKQDAIDYWEIDEAFAAQVLGVNRELKIDLSRLNAVGSGIALGHPVGATGARLIFTMINEMKRRGAHSMTALPFVQVEGPRTPLSSS